VPIGVETPRRFRA